MSLSLREQLLAAGLVSAKQAKQAEQQQRQQSKQQPARNAPSTEQKLAAQQAQARAAKAARDQELNRQQQIKAEKKARQAEIKQLIEQNRLPKVETDDYYNYIVGPKIRRMSVTAQLREDIIHGTIVIVRCEGRYDLVPAAIAERIRERDERAVIPYQPPTTTQEQDDAYKDYVVPDDLMW